MLTARSLGFRRFALPSRTQSFFQASLRGVGAKPPENFLPPPPPERNEIYIIYIQKIFTFTCVRPPPPEESLPPPPPRKFQVPPRRKKSGRNTARTTSTTNAELIVLIEEAVTINLMIAHDVLIIISSNKTRFSTLRKCGIQMHCQKNSIRIYN